MKTPTYHIIETFTTKRNTRLFSFMEQIKDEERQVHEYLIAKLGKDYKTIEVYPPKRKKIDCPQQCGNSYAKLKAVYLTSNKPRQVLCMQCANVLCEEFFYLLAEEGCE